MDTYELGPFRLDTHSGMLLRGTEPVALGGRAVALLRALVERPGALVSKDALIKAAWPGQVVEDSNLPVQIAALRRALSEAPGGDRWIETMPRRGYRFVGPVVAEAENSATAAPPQVAAPRDAAAIEHDEAERRQITAFSCELVGIGVGAGETGLEDVREAAGAFQQSSRPSWRGRVIVGTGGVKGCDRRHTVKTDGNDTRAIAKSSGSGGFTAVHLKPAGSQELPFVAEQSPNAVGPTMALRAERSRATAPTAGLPASLREIGRLVRHLQRTAELTDWSDVVGA